MNILVLVGLIVLCVNPLWAKHNHTSQTFMFPRPIYHNLAEFNGPWLYLTTQRPLEHGGTFQVIPSFQESPQHSCNSRVAGYFSMFCKQRLLVAGDLTLERDARDVRAEWLRLPSDFVGTMCLNPKQTQEGLVFAYQQDLDYFTDNEFFRYLYMNVQVPVVWVKNRLGLAECIQQQGTPIQGQPNSIVQALVQSDLQFAKMYQGSRSDQGIAEVRFDIGTRLINNRNYLLQTYSSLIIPTFRKNCPIFIFNPVVGINGHWGIGAGLNLQVPITDSYDCLDLIAFLDIENRYYISNDQYRTFDLKTRRFCYKKEWSRYLQLRRPNVQETIFAANVLTLYSKVHPWNMVNLATGLRLFVNAFHFELGYQLWVHPDERVRIKSPKCCGDGFCFQEFGIAGAELGSAQRSTIRFQAEEDPEFVYLRLDDIDLCSASAQGNATNMAYGSVAFIGNGTVVAPMACLGIFYENAVNNANFSNWGVWGKLGLAF